MGLQIKPLAAAILALGATPTIAQQDNTNGEQPVIQFGETVVAAERNPAATEKEPGTVVVDRVQLEEQQPESVAQVLKYEPNIDVVGGPRYSSQSPSIRGLGGVRVLQTIDGARQNFNSGHRGTYQMDPELLKQVEVKKGPASSLWGSGAIGGVVAQSTKSARDLLRDGRAVGGYLKEELGTNGDSTETSAAVYGESGSLDYLLNASVSDHDNLEIGGGDELEDSASENTALLARAGWQLAENQRLDISLRHNNREENAPSNPGSNVGTSSPLVERDSTDRNLTANYLLQAFEGRHTSKLTVYRNETRFDEFRPTMGEGGQRDDTEVETTGIAINNATDGLGAQWIYGLDWYRDDVNTVRDGENRPADLDAETDTLGLYTRADFAIGEHLTLTPGLRYDRYEAESAELQGSARDDSAVSPSFAAALQTADWMTLTASYAEAFRAPGVEEMYTEGTHFCYGDFGFGPICNTFLPNPDLEAEEAQNTELRADLQFAGLWNSGDQLSASAAVFRNRVDNFIEQLTVNPHPSFFFPMNTTYQNVEEAELEGFELAANYLVGDLELGLSYGQTEGKDLGDDSYLSNIPADKWVLDIGHYFLQRDLKTGLRATRASAQEQLPESETREFDGYTLADAYVTWEPATGAARGLKLGLALDNLTDEEYRVAFQELTMPGRNIKLSASYSF
ncbi:TonB-dependent hemoglobin/transferrin/lactoferrin family receptor [Microbulbifer litoralis]|uniref:TonB-dependent hemoglobin/transferrin/lactoferrin family receptor n=1 Tax=Microbulbifer litoralis TaxID=2933965 RepID=UPI0020280304|nr:TonB-dependent hemoglobin/transferrin/lactoferrin family receptor [Microbulbifer sp. GX H0434]